ncbi:hypothetical protein BBJ28_00002244 [Nothophytophthora sp. Chile5]|nr:hypothetical protein BBJ28_00002244 [Nothophytophthora sp. Chile5]
MRRTRSSSLAEASAPPQRLRSLRSSTTKPAFRAYPLRPSRQTAVKVATTKKKEGRGNARDSESENEGESNNASDSDGSDKETAEVPVELTEYERKRRENIQRNLAFMQAMGVSTAKIAARTAVGHSPEALAKKETQAKKRASRAANQAERRIQPTRKSRRLEGKMVDVEPVDDPDDKFELRAQRIATRKSRDSRFSVLDAAGGESKAFLQDITADSESEQEKEEEEEEEPLADHDGIRYSLAAKDVVKAVQERIYSVAFLPRADRVVVACGDKIGHVALWSPSHGRLKAKTKLENAVKAIAHYRPHQSPVCQLIFPDATKLMSASYDGTVREFDLRAAESSEVFDTEDDAGIMSMVAAATPQCYYVGCDDGSVRLIDGRTDTTQSSSYMLHEKKINTVDQHPSLDFCVATASLDRTVCLWDVRKVSSNKNTPLVTLPHARSVNCAYFSPRGGAWLVTVGQDSYIDMFDTSSLTQRQATDSSTVELPSPLRVRHNNITGRWLTKLHATWDPKRPSQFVIGCMEQPRRLQIFRAGRRRPVHELTSDNFASVHSINAFHPQLELVVGGNSSGRLALWRGKKTIKAEVKAEIKTENIKVER